MLLLRTELCTGLQFSQLPRSHTRSEAIAVFQAPTFYPSGSPYRDLALEPRLSARKEVWQIFAALRSLSSALANTALCNVDLLDHPWYSDDVYHVQRTLMELTLPVVDELTLPIVDEEAGGGSLGGLICGVSAADQSLASAALLFTYVVFCNSPTHVSSLNTGSIVQRVIDALVLENSVPTKAPRERILWTLTIAGIMADGGQGQRRWFVAQLANLLGLSLDDGEVLQDLERVAWHRVLEVPRRRLWDEVREATQFGVMEEDSG